MTGLRAFIAAGLPVSLSAVVLRSTLHALPILLALPLGWRVAHTSPILPKMRRRVIY